jgi:hypothetical protein
VEIQVGPKSRWGSLEYLTKCPGTKQTKNFGGENSFFGKNWMKKGQNPGMLNVTGYVWELIRASEV